MKRRVRQGCGVISPPPTSSLGNFHKDSAFLYDQKVGDQFKLEICFEMDPYV